MTVRVEPVIAMNDSVLQNNCSRNNNNNKHVLTLKFVIV